MLKIGVHIYLSSIDMKRVDCALIKIALQLCYDLVRILDIYKIFFKQTIVPVSILKHFVRSYYKFYI